MTKWALSRRRFLEGATVVAAAGTVLARARGAYAAGKLSVDFWDHWVPGDNDQLAKLCSAWAATEKVDLQCDFMTNEGNNDRLTIAAARSARPRARRSQIPGPAPDPRRQCPPGDVRGDCRR